MNNTSTVTTKYQVVIPKNIRRAVKIKTGDKVTMQTMGDLIILHPPKKQGWASSLRGLGKNLWRGIDPLDYINQERQSWQK